MNIRVPGDYCRHCDKPIYARSVESGERIYEPRGFTGEAVWFHSGNLFRHCNADMAKAAEPKTF